MSDSWPPQICLFVCVGLLFWSASLHGASEAFVLIVHHGGLGVEAGCVLPEFLRDHGIDLGPVVALAAELLFAVQDSEPALRDVDITAENKRCKPEIYSYKTYRNRKQSKLIENPLSNEKEPP